MKRLYRSRKDRIIAGVCGGIAEYFAVDPVIVRVIAVLLFFWGGSGLIAYIIATIIVPEKPVDAGAGADQKTSGSAKRSAKKEVVSKEAEPVAKGSDTGALITGIILIIVGGVFMLRNIPFLNHYYWWFRHNIGHIFWPLVIIGIGIAVIIRGTRR